MPTLITTGGERDFTLYLVENTRPILEGGVRVNHLTVDKNNYKEVNITDGILNIITNSGDVYSVPMSNVSMYTVGSPFTVTY